MKRLTLRNQNCLSRMLLKVLFSTGEFRWFTFSDLSAFLFEDLIFLLLFLSRKKGVWLVILGLYQNNQHSLTSWQLLPKSILTDRLHV